MALTESRTETDAPVVAGPAPSTLDGLLGSADHKRSADSGSVPGCCSWSAHSACQPWLPSKAST